MHRYAALVVGLIWSQVLPGAEPMRDGATIRIRDYLNRDWRNEAVHYDLEFEKGAFPQAALSLVNGRGKSAPTQLESVTLFEDGSLKSATLWFQASVGPFATETWALKAGKAEVKAPLTLVRESRGEIMLTNRQVGIALRKRLNRGQGPIARIRLSSGRWIGGSSLVLPNVPRDYQVEVLSRGPVFAELRCSVQLSKSSVWELRLRLQANEPVILVEEKGSIDKKSSSSFALNLSDKFAPHSLLYRTGKGRLGRNKTWTIAAGEVYTLEPWLYWWERERQGNCFSLYNDVDLLSVAAGHAGDWVDPKLKRGIQQRPRFAVTHSAGTTRMKAPLTTGRRRWMISCLPQEPVLREFADEKHQFYSLLPYRYLIKHGHLPLDLVKDYVYEWPQEEAQYPHLLFTQENVKRFQDSIVDQKVYLDAIPGIVRVKQVLAHNRVDKAIATYFATGDARLGAYITDSVLRMLQHCVEYYTHQPDIPYGCAPHHQRLLTGAMLLADAALWGGHCTEEQRQRILAQAAFLGYTITRPEYWSPERGYAANPNMTTSVYGYITSIGCFLNTHPEAETWTARGLKELERQLNTWSDNNGGWLEAPHYAMVSFDPILSSFVMAQNAGLGDYLKNPKIKKVANWFSQISTPPDSRFLGYRHLPPLGNSYVQEPTGEFGLLAFLYRDTDPDFAAEMKWMHLQHKSWPTPGIGGAYPGFSGYRTILSDPAIEPKAPKWTSTLFPKTGVILRHGFPDPRESMLHMIAGSNHAHYDKDSGSITIWGKGRIIADDFGYQGYMPGDDHSMLVSPVAPDASIMTVESLSTSADLDYVSARKRSWQRQIAFVKDADLKGPAYFVIRDTLAVAAPATWRLWLTGSDLRVKNKQALLVGNDDVDTDIFLGGIAAAPTTDNRTRQCWGMDSKGRYGRLKVTQKGLKVTWQKARMITTLVYPRLKTGAPPAVRFSEDGKQLTVTHNRGTDVILLGREPFTYEKDDLSFHGTAALVKKRGKKTSLHLGAPGSLTAAGKTISRAIRHKTR